MKKRLLAALSTVMALIVSFTGAGCNLVTTDSDRDMNQVVATVQITGYDQRDEIKKSDMIMAFLNYGYLYVQSYGYTREQTFNLIINNLVNTRILVQNAVMEAEAVNAEDASGNPLEDYSEYPVAAYLDEGQILSAKYSALSDINTLLDSYTDDGSTDKKGDTAIGDVRTAPDNAANAEDEVTDEEKREYIDESNTETNPILSNMTEDYRRAAFNDVVKLLTNNSLLGDYKNGDLKTTDYYKDTLRSYYESELLTAYFDDVLAAARAQYTFDDIAARYEEIYNKQKGWSNAEFIAALESTTATEPILYCGLDGYGYVYNLLLGVNDYQTTAIEDIRTDNPNISDTDYAAARKDILQNTVVSDLRSSWITAGYDGELSSEGVFKFTGDYTFVNDPANSLAFQGTVRHLNPEQEEEDDYVAEYGIDGVKTFGLDEFIDFMNGYLGGTITASEYTDLGDSVYGGSIYGLSGVEEYDAKIKELIFAFSTDSGSLSSGKGYIIKPPVDGSNTEEYVDTFAAAGRKLLETGDSSYVIVASDYGYHIMFYSELLTVHDEYETLEGYLNSLGIDMMGASDWETYYNNMLADYEDFEDKDNYLYLLTDSVISAALTNAETNAQNEIVNKYRYDTEGCVQIFSELYADLLG